MLEAISIGVSENSEAVINRFENEVQALNSQGICFKLKISNKGDLTFLGCGIEDQDIPLKGLKIYIAKVITDIIFEDWSSIIVNKIIRDNYYYFSEAEKKSIKSTVLKLFSNQERENILLKQKPKIKNRVLDYLEKNNEFVLDGFINFRLKDYLSEIEALVDNVVSDFLMEKEYLEFIRLLRYFVDIQDPKVAEIHVVLKDYKNFNLLDQNGLAIENEYLNGLSADLMSNSINYEDLLISALITLAPKRIVIHTKKRDEFTDTLKTIENIFGERASYCPGCQICPK